MTIKRDTTTDKISSNIVSTFSQLNQSKTASLFIHVCKLRLFFAVFSADLLELE